MRQFEYMSSGDIKQSCLVGESASLSFYTTEISARVAGLCKKLPRLAMLVVRTTKIRGGKSPERGGKCAAVLVPPTSYAPISFVTGARLPLPLPPLELAYPPQHTCSTLLHAKLRGTSHTPISLPSCAHLIIPRTLKTATTAPRPFRIGWTNSSVRSNAPPLERPADLVSSPLSPHSSGPGTPIWSKDDQTNPDTHKHQSSPRLLHPLPSPDRGQTKQ